MNDQKPVKLKVYPIYGPHGIEGSREYCGACYVQVPRNVTHCPKCGVPIYGRTGEGSFTKCPSCSGLIPYGADKCPNCRRPTTNEN